LERERQGSLAPLLHVSEQIAPYPRAAGSSWLERLVRAEGETTGRKFERRRVVAIGDGW